MSLEYSVTYVPERFKTVCAPVHFRGGCLLKAHATRSCISSTYDRDNPRRFGKAKWGHVIVDAFVISWPYAVGFMPYSDIAVDSHCLVERCPCRQVGLIIGARISF